MFKFKHLVLTSAFIIASCAAVFSITGISQLFVGATISAGIMAGALELGKLVSISYLYRYLKTAPKILKMYLSIGAVVLMLITSLGIYGYLSSAYASAAQGIQSTNNQISLYNTQIQNIESDVDRLNTRSTELQSIRGQQENRLDSLLAKGRPTGTQQSIIRQADNDIRANQREIASLNARRDSLQLLRANTQNSIATQGKIGTFYYVAQTLGIPLDTVVKWFILIIVFVFDPLSITLVLAYNHIIKEEQSHPAEEWVPVVPKTVKISRKLAPDPLPEAPGPIQANKPNLPYYADPQFDWKSDTRWHNDPEAKYYLSTLGVDPRV